MRVGVTGSSGLIGTALTGHLARSGHVVVPIVRNEAAADQIAWDPADGVLDPGDLRRLDAVVHLAGAGIGDRRWTDDRKRTILESRVAGTRLIAEAMASADGPSILLSGSAIGYYGDRGDEIVDESSRSGNGFLADVCVEWERSTRVAEEAGIRVAHLRTGIVLSRRGGALKKMLPLFKIGLGGRFGAGTQWMSWISIVDEVRAIEYLLTSERSGPVNLTAPDACRNDDFAAALAEVLHRPSFVPVPEFGPKLLLGSELADALLFEGQRVFPAALVADGFEFEHSTVDRALPAVLDER
jgi:uncharacterized protein (TIGR01777 family)